MMKDCIAKVIKCLPYQSFAKNDTRLTTFYTLVTVAIPFTIWGVNLLEPLPQVPGRNIFCIVVVDYFTKWVEA